MNSAENTSSKVASFLSTTELLDYQHPSLQRLVVERGWADLPEYERIGAIYDFVRNEIAFGYNVSDDLRLRKCWRMAWGSAIRKHPC